jgi:hypothetical protein
MQVFLYSKQRGDSVGRLQRHIERCPHLRITETLHSIEDLSRTLLPRKGIVQETILVLFATDSKDLLGLLSIGELLNKSRLILVLPDQRQAMVKTAHRLMPRYIGYADGDLSDVAAVLKKMIHYLNGKEPKVLA